jgi:hypothetical protein
MAHFAKLDKDNTVIDVLVVDNSVLLVDNVENETLGISFMKSLTTNHENWKQTSYNSRFRKIFAYPGCIYDPKLDAFLPAKPYSTWKFNEASWKWEPPIPFPKDGRSYIWDNDKIEWVIFE